MKKLLLFYDDFDNKDLGLVQNFYAKVYKMTKFY